MNRIKELRKKYPMSQKELAERLHISQASISGYEGGTVEPDIELMKQMAEIFGVTLDYLMGFDTEPKKEWNVEYPPGVALRTYPQPQPGLSLSEADITRIAERVAQMNTDAKTSPVLNSNEQQLIEEYRMLSTAGRIRVQRLIGVLLDNKFNDQ